MKVLAEQDREKFFSLWIPMLQYIDEKLYGNKEEARGQLGMFVMDRDRAMRAIMALWTKEGLLDSYLEEHPKIAGEDKKIIQGWKKRITSTFVVERHTSNGSILVDDQTGQVYLVTGMMSALEELTQYAALPVLVKGTLFPFRNAIINDGMFELDKDPCPEEKKKWATQRYHEARTKGEIRQTM